MHKTFPLTLLSLEECCWNCSFSVCVHWESLQNGKGEQGNRHKEEVWRAKVLCANYPMIHQLITFIRLGTSLPFAGCQWDQCARLTGMPCKLPTTAGWGLSTSISVSCPHGPLEWSSGKGTEPAGGERIRAEILLWPPKFASWQDTLWRSLEALQVISGTFQIMLF